MMSSSFVLNVNCVKKCAFCKHWYDPTNSAIAPKAPNVGLWEITDTNKKSICLKKNHQMPASASCNTDYEPKV